MLKNLKAAFGRIINNQSTASETPSYILLQGVRPAVPGSTGITTDSPQDWTLIKNMLGATPEITITKFPRTAMIVINVAPEKLSLPLIEKKDGALRLQWERDLAAVRPGQSHYTMLIIFEGKGAKIEQYFNNTPSPAPEQKPAP